MHYEIKIPNRSLLFVGPQRCGKTFAIMAAVAQASQEFKVVVVCPRPQWTGIVDHLAAFGQLHNIVHVSTECPDVPAYLASKHLRIADVHAVAIMTSTVFVDVGTVKFYDKPTDSVISFLETLCDPKAYLPYVYVESHIAGHENDVAKG